MTLKACRIFAYSMSLLAFVLSVLTLTELQYLGFPDGHLTEWDSWRKILGYLFIGLSVLSSFGFLRLGWDISGANLGKKLLFISLTYGTFTFLFVFLDRYLAQFSGRGG